MQGQGRTVSREAIEADLAARDERDANRAQALAPGPDAALLDTSAMGREVAIAAAIALVEKQLASR
jgi:cytidylate kinase